MKSLDTDTMLEVQALGKPFILLFCSLRIFSHLIVLCFWKSTCCIDLVEVKILYLGQKFCDFCKCASMQKQLLRL